MEPMIKQSVLRLVTDVAQEIMSCPELLDLFEGVNESAVVKGFNDGYRVRKGPVGVSLHVFVL
jgi:hypothetical protein